jgi:hypothetical protein
MTEKESPPKKTKNKKIPEEIPIPIPPLDFSSLVLPFLTQALISLGQINDLKIKREEEHLELSKRLIDLLDLLKDKTKGNLDDAEQKFIESSLQQLKISYMEKAKIIKL